MSAPSTRLSPGRRLIALAASVTVAMGVCVVIGLTMGNPPLTPAGVLEAWGATAADPAHIVVTELRAPRVVLAVIAGGGLGLAGALMQDAMRNPLAAPDLLGVTGGCALVIAGVAVLGLQVPRPMVPLAATAGGLAIGLAVIIVGRRHADPAALVLVGLACSTFLTGSVIAVITLGAPSDVGLFYQYLLGSLANRTWDDVRIILPWIAAAVPLGLLLSGRLNVLRLGDDVAAALGVRVAATRRAVLVASCLLTAAVVAVSGPIGFVALLTPHIVRRAVGTTDARIVNVGSILVGAALLLCADQIGRALTHPREVPAGVWTVLAGAPVLLVLLRTRMAQR